MELDLPLEALRAYRPEVYEPPDFDDFWAARLAEAAAAASATSFEPVETGLRLVDAFDVTFSGHGGDPIKAWLMLPHDRQGTLPVVVEFIGYGGGRALPHDWLGWACAGYAHFVMDARGQGSTWSVGDSADPGDSGGPAFPGYMTRGITDPATYYYVRLFVDAARAVDAAREHPEVAAERVVVHGGSQGGGLTLAAASLRGVQGAMPDVPLLSHFRRAVQITADHPYGEISNFAKIHRDKVDQIFHTLGYVDVVNHAKRSSAPALFSVGLSDTITPPSTVFAAYNWYGGPKQIEVYPFNGHEGGGTHHHRLKLDFARRILNEG